MPKLLLHKTWLLLLLWFTFSVCYARQLHTVADGNWTDPQIWYNQLTPGSTYDTIEVFNHINLSNSYLVLAENDVLKIDSGASLCGIDTFEMFNNAKLIVNGYLATDFFTGAGNGNSEFIGPTGFMDIGYGGAAEFGQFTDSLGCLVVHLGNAHCNYTCTYDPNIFLHYNGSLVTFEVDSNAIPGNYVYFFGDGENSGQTTWYQVHEYNDTGYYNATVVLFPCCTPETLSVIVHVTTLYTGLLPMGWCHTTGPVIKNAMPVTDAIHLNHIFCTGVQGVVKLYSITGALHYTLPFTGNELNEVIPVNTLAGGCYVLSIETDAGDYRQKVMIER